MIRLWSPWARVAAIAAVVVASASSGAVRAQVGVGESDAVEQAPARSGEPTRAIAGEALVRTVTGREGEPIRDRRVRVRVPKDGPKIVYEFSERGGTLTSAQLQAERYVREAWEPMVGVPDRILKGGPINLVTTWSPRYLPFRLAFNKLEAGEVTLVLRADGAGAVRNGQLAAPDDPADLDVDRPVRSDDTVVISAPPRAAGEYAIDRVVAASGALILVDPPEDAEGVAYRVVRRGSLKNLFEAGPEYTRVTDEPGLPITYVWPDPRTDDSRVFVEKRFEAGQHPYELRLTTTIHSFDDEMIRVQSGLQVTGWQHPELTSGNIFTFPTFLYAGSCYTGGELERVEFPDLVDESESFQTHTEWAGVDTRYFLSAAVQTNVEGAQCHLSADAPPLGVVRSVLWAPAVETIKAGAGACVPDWLAHREGVTSCAEAADVLGHDITDPLKAIRATWQSARLDVEGAERQRLDDAWSSIRGRQRSISRYTLYLGPKEDPLLKQTGHDLSASHDFGIVAVLAEPLHLLLGWFHDLVGHWAIAIALLTLVLKTILLPLTNKSFNNMQKMTKLRPQMQKIQEEFKDDREALGRAQMALFKREKVNPLGGCLPMLIQMPIWFALYRTILSSVELYNAPLGGWVQDLSSPDPYYILPVLLGLMMLAQSFVMPTAAGMEGGQAKFLKYGMPVMFSVFMIALPSGLVLYILVNTVLTIFQNLIIRRRMA